MRGFLSILALALVLVLGGAGAFLPDVGAATAQDAEALPDYDAWEKVAQRAETALVDRRASNTALEQLRGELVDWRTRFLQAQDVNQARISTLKNQLAALGGAPEEAGIEPAELTLRREELSAQLSELEAPRRQAEEAYTRADGLISEIDSIIRERQAERLFELKPSPANPILWPEAIADFGESLGAVRKEVSSAWGSETLQKSLRENLPITLFYLLAAFVLLARGRAWMVRLTQRVQAGEAGAATRLRAFGVSVGQVLLPVVGIYALVQAFFFTGLLGFRGQLIADGLIPLGVAFFSARWLALRLLPDTTMRRSFLQLPEAAAGNVRRYAAGLGLLWGLNRLLGQLADFEGYSETTRVILHFPLITLAGYLLFRFGRILRRDAVEAGGDGAVEWNFRSRSTDVLGRALIIVGVGGPLAALVGYYTAAEAVLFPSILSLGLLAFLTVLSGVSRDLYALFSGSDDDKARDALIPVLMSFALVLASIPVFALIWGARVSDLTEVWARFREGFQIGDTRISPTDFLTFAIVFSIGYVLTRLLQSTLKTSILPKTSIDKGGQSAIVSGLGYLGIFLAAVVAITTAGIDLSSLAIVAGALSVGIGFGLQNIVSNFVSGIILLIERPITEGDWIEVGGNMGYVRDISVRSTRIETFDRTDVIIPNSDLVSGTVVNFTRGNLIGRAIISVGVAYGTDTKRVAEILKEIAEAHPMVMMKPGPSVHFVGFGADSLDFQIRAILRDVNFSLTVKSDIHHEIARRFTEEGIEIPFAQRDLWLRNPETLREAPKPKARAKPKPKQPPPKKDV